jgi:FkbM family methyltransferase
MVPAQQVTLANGLNLWAPNAFEAHTLYREIFVDRQYAADDIHLEPGSVIFDVGANVGLFSIAMMQRCPGARIHAFEPIPDLFEILSRNLSEHVPAAHRRNIGLGASTATMRFAFDRFSTFSASAYPEVFKTEIPRADYAAAAIDAAHRITPSAVTATLLAGLERPLARSLVTAFMLPVLGALELRRKLFLRHCDCAIETLSEALAQSGEAGIDLLKIDVEGAEEDVVAGIDTGDWPRLRQLVVEVHDIDGRLDRMVRKLGAHGYAVRVEPGKWPVLQLLKISTVYAVRQSAEAC